MRFSLEQGRELVRYARDSILNNRAEIKNFGEKRGVFVTLYTYPDKKLRGCIGFPYPIYPLSKGISMAARSAAYEDPRFHPIENGEEFVVEVSILTEPQEIKASPAELPSKVKVGEDGLIVECDGMSGLLLPIVFIEYQCTPEAALEMTCEKAGLPKDAWKNENYRFLKFQTQVFAEKKPNGEIEQKL